MKRLLLVALVVICFSPLVTDGQGPSNDVAHTPKQGTAERQAILDTLRNGQQITFKVHFMKVHHGWAWVDVTPLDDKGQAVAEGGPNLLQLKDGSWKVLDLSKVPEDPNDPLGPEDASPGFIKNLRRTYPGVPADIFPKPSH